MAKYMVVFIQAHDAAGRGVAQWDARLWALRDSEPTAPANQTTVYSLFGALLAHDSVDAALGALLHQTDARGHAQGFVYTQAGQLRQATLRLAGGTEQRLVHALDYDAAGRLRGQTAGNGVLTGADYHPADGRLQQLRVRKADGTLLQDLSALPAPAASDGGAGPGPR